MQCGVYWYGESPPIDLCEAFVCFLKGVGRCRAHVCKCIDLCAEMFLMFVCSMVCVGELVAV